MKAYFLCLLAVGALLAPTFATAETVMRTGADVSVAPDQTVAGNYYVSVFFGKTTMSGIVERDMLALGSSVTINGEVKEDLHVLGGNVQVHGTVGGDVRIVGGEVTIAEKVAGDIVVAGGSLTLLPTAEVAGDVFFFGGTADIGGKVEGSVYGRAERFSIDAAVAKNVDITSAASTEFGERANVVGDVRYTSRFEMARNPNATIGGEVVHNREAEPDARTEARALLVPFLVVLFTTLALYLIFKRELEDTVLSTFASYGLASLAGLGVLVLGPLLSFILMITVLGSVIGFMSLLLTALVIVAGVAVAPILAGALLARVFNRGYEVSLLTIVTGASVLYGTLLFLPVIGVPLVLAFTVLSIGGIALAIYRAIS